MATETSPNGTAPKRARKTSTKTSTKTKREKPAQPTEEVKEEPASIPPFTPDAWAYISQASLKGVPEPLIYFIGGRTPLQISRAMGRPMDLEETKLLVVPDGGPTACALTEKTFQPVKYVPFLSKKMEDGLKAGQRLDEVELFYGGCYYVDHQRKVSAFSGPVYFYNRRDNEYQSAKSSPLVVIAHEMRKKYGRMLWGVPYDIIAPQVEAREESHKRHKAAEKLAKKFIDARGSGRRGKGSFGALPEEALEGLTRASKRCKDRGSRRERLEVNGE